jgi:hypothetical protein
MQADVYGHSIFGNPVYAESASVGSQPITGMAPLVGAVGAFGGPVPLTPVPVGGSVPILPPQIGPAPDFGISVFDAHVPFGAAADASAKSETGKSCAFMGRAEYWNPSWVCTDALRTAPNSALENYVQWSVAKMAQLGIIPQTGNAATNRKAAASAGTKLSAALGGATAVAAAWQADVASGAWPLPGNAGGDPSAVLPAAVGSGAPSQEGMVISGGGAPTISVQKDNTMLYVGLGLAAVAGIGAFMYWQKSKKKSATPNPRKKRARRAAESYTLVSPTGTKMTGKATRGICFSPSFSLSAIRKRTLRTPARKKKK